MNFFWKFSFNIENKTFVGGVFMPRKSTQMFEDYQANKPCPMLWKWVQERYG
jgi:hypothetical protein